MGFNLSRHKLVALMRYYLYSTLLFFIIGVVPAQTKDSSAERYAATILASDLSKHLHVLASDEYEGRETGKKGQKLAAKYIKEKFESYGVHPLESGDYFQSIPLVIQYPEGSSVVINSKKYEFGKDFYYFKGFNDTLIDATNIVFLGYGIDDELYSDYKNRDVRGMVGFIFDGEPYNKKGVSHITGLEGPSEWSESWRLKLEAARNHGVTALMLLVPDIEANLKIMKHSIYTSSMLIDKQETTPHKFTPSIYISEEMARTIVSKNKVDLVTLKKRITKTGKPNVIDLAVDITINIERKKERISSENVVGYIEGGELKDEIVVISAHYDHIGMSDGEVYNGADDDGSGTVALMEIAEAFSKAKKEEMGSKRSILVLAVAGEEKGLLGSQYYVENPLFPLKNTVVDLNIDMIGREDKKHNGNPNYIYLIGSDKLSSDLHTLSETANETYTKLELDYTYNQPDDPNRFYYRSDHYNFAKNNIPVIFYFSGVHDDYHKPTDTVDKIDFQKMEKITRLVFYTAWEIANKPERIAVDKKSDFDD